MLRRLSVVAVGPAQVEVQLISDVEGVLVREREADGRLGRAVGIGKPTGQQLLAKERTTNSIVDGRHELDGDRPGYLWEFDSAAGHDLRQRRDAVTGCAPRHEWRDCSSAIAKTCE